MAAGSEVVKAAEMHPSRLLEATICQEGQVCVAAVARMHVGTEAQTQGLYLPDLIHKGPMRQQLTNRHVFAVAAPQSQSVQTSLVNTIFV